MDLQKQQFYKFFVQQIQVNEETLEVIKVLDVSMMIKFWVANADKNVLEMANACVSHEMRNPLNSINGMITKIYSVIENIVCFIDGFGDDLFSF